MKKVIFISLLMSVFTVFAGEPEFDGGYIKLSDESFMEMKTIKAYKTKLVKGNVNIMALMKKRSTYYTIDKSSSVKVAGNKFKGVSVKGNHKYKSFSLHPLLSKDVTKLGFFENKGPASKTKPFYYPGKKVEVRSKSTGSNSYYFQPKNKLERGDYVAWIGTNFWLFTIK